MVCRGRVPLNFDKLTACLRGTFFFFFLFFIVCLIPYFTINDRILHSRKLLSMSKKIQLGRSDLKVSPICLGTMTFGEQVSETDAHQILAHSLTRGVDFLDTAEMYAVPPKAETFNAP